MAQIGTIKLETQNSGVVDVPVFETGDSASGIYEFVRAETASGTGFIPVTDPADATYPYLRVQSQNNGIVAVTDTAGSEIPDSGVSRWTFDDADTDSGSALDVWNNNDGAINGATTGVTGANQTYTTNEGYSFDGTDDYVDVASVESQFQNPGVTVSLWVNGSGLAFDVYNGRWYIGIDRSISTWNLSVFDGSTNNTADSGISTTSSWIHLTGVQYSDGDLEIYVDGAAEGTATSGTAASNTPTGPHIGQQTEGSNNFSGEIDDVRVYSKALTATEVSNLYNTGSISG